MRSDADACVGCRAIRPIPLPQVDADFYKAQMADSAPEVQNREGSTSYLESDWESEEQGKQQLRAASRQMLQKRVWKRKSGRRVSGKQQHWRTASWTARIA